MRFGGFDDSSLCNIVSMFTVWLFEQRDRDDSVGLFARVAFYDYNAGCASVFKDAVAWKKHFEVKHVRKAPNLMELLGDAFVEYCSELGKSSTQF